MIRHFLRWFRGPLAASEYRTYRQGGRVHVWTSVDGIAPDLIPLLAADVLRTAGRQDLAVLVVVEATGR